jgi:hypothetical protein
MPIVPVQKSFKDVIAVAHADLSQTLPERLNLGRLKKCPGV